ncbi:MAG: hypothetical protein ACI4KB_05230 [Oscillospiraceae bacterium]
MLKIHSCDPNNNAELISDIIKCIDCKFNDYYWHISDLEIIANDREDYIYNKPLFSERVLSFQKQVDDEHGVYIKKNLLLKILFESRTIYRGVFSCFNNGTGKLASYSSSVENTSGQEMPTDVVFEMRILDGDLIFIKSKNSDVLNFIKENFSEYIQE